MIRDFAQTWMERVVTCGFACSMDNLLLSKDDFVVIFTFPGECTGRSRCACKVKITY